MAKNFVRRQERTRLAIGFALHSTDDLIKLLTSGEKLADIERQAIRAVLRLRGKEIK